MEGALAGRQCCSGPGNLGWAGRKPGRLWGRRFSLCPAPWDHLPSPVLFVGGDLVGGDLAGGR